MSASEYLCTASIGEWKNWQLVTTGAITPNYRHSLAQDLETMLN
jgi:hypothetical protein